MPEQVGFVWRLCRWLTPRFKSFKDVQTVYSHRRRRWHQFCALVRRAANNLHELDEHLEVTAEEIVIDLTMAGDVLLWRSVFAQSTPVDTFEFVKGTFLRDFSGNSRQSTPADLFEFREWVSCNQAKLPEIKLFRGTERRLIHKWNLPQYDGFFQAVIECDAPAPIYLPSRDNLESIITACGPLYTIRSPREIGNWLDSCLGSNVLPLHGLEGLSTTSSVPGNRLIACTETLVAPDCQRLIEKGWELARVFRCLPKEEPVVKTPDEARRALDALMIAIDAKLPSEQERERQHRARDDDSNSQPPANDEKNGWAFEPGMAIFRGKRIDLSGKPWALLKALVEANGKRLDAQQLKDSAWGHDEFPDDRALVSQLSILRTKLRKSLQLPENTDPVPCVDRGPRKAWQLKSAANFSI